MQKIHQKSVWYFFVRYLGGSLIAGGAFSIFLILPMIFFAIASLMKASQAGLSNVLERLPFLVVFLLPLIFLMLLIIIFCYIWSKLVYRNWRYELKEKILNINKGVIHKKYITIPYQNIQNVDIQRDLVARFLKLSNLLVQTAGYSGIRGAEGKIPGLDPKIAQDLKKTLLKKIEKNKNNSL